MIGVRRNSAASMVATSMALRSALLKTVRTERTQGRCSNRAARCTPTAESRHSGTGTDGSISTSGCVMK